MEDLIEMNKKERERLKVMIRLEHKALNQEIAAKQLGIGIRQVQRLLKAYREKGEISLIDPKRRRKGNNKLPTPLIESVVKLVVQNYHDFGPKFAHEKLTEIHSLKLSLSSTRKIMLENEIWKPRKSKQVKIHQRREPKEYFGEMLQMDGSYHDWFEGRAPNCCLIVIIDDATSRLMMLQFVPWETTFAYFKAIKDCIKKYGKPLSVYTDRLAVFETTRKNEINYKETQFHRAMSSLGVKLILARSPQAKGRVERANETLQDRLVKEMRLAHISSIEEGNAFLPTYIKMHNKKFAKRPKSPIDAHTTIDSEINLEKILCLHYERKISKDLMINFKGATYQIIETEHKYRLGRQKVLVIEKEKDELEFIHNNRSLKFKLYRDLPAESQPNKAKRGSIADVNFNLKRFSRSPVSRFHPWRIWRKKKIGT